MKKFFIEANSGSVTSPASCSTNFCVEQVQEASVEACRRNIKFNDFVAVSKGESHLADARVYMLENPKKFDVVDLDPYGSPSVFLDSAVQFVVDGGILMCTATDMDVLCGSNGEVCYSKSHERGTLSSGY